MFLRASLTALLLALSSTYASARSPFAPLKNALGEREAIIAVPERGRVEVRSVSAAGEKKLFAVDFVQREQDVYGRYRDFPRFAFLPDRGLLVFETPEEGRLSAYDFSTGAVAPFGRADIAAIEGMARSISPDGRYFAGECRLSANDPAVRSPALRKTLFVGRVLDPERLRETLMGFGGRPPVEDPAFRDSVNRISSLKTYVGADQWRVAEKDRLLDVRFVSWLPDASGFTWLESKAQPGDAGATGLNDEIWFYEMATKKQWRITTAGPAALYQAWISDPLFAVSPMRALCVNRTFRYKTVVYSAFLVDADSDRFQKVLSNAALVAIR